MPLPLVMQLDGICDRNAPKNVLPPSDELITIDQPVGEGFKAKNLDKDVRTIQESLNKITAIDEDRARRGIKRTFGGPVPLLDVDGKCGPKTKAAIQKFQTKQFGSFDRLIEPGKRTITRLNQILFSNAPVDPKILEEIKPKMVQHLAVVSRAIHAAQTNLLIALTPSGGFDLGGVRARADSRIDRHFGLNTLSPDRREQQIRNILGVYNIYASVLLMPGSLGAGAFELDTTGDPRIAFTFSNGFFRTGQVSPELQIPLDRIFLGRRSFFALSDGEFCAFIMLHEMAHFVGFPGGSEIPDNGRGW